MKFRDNMEARTLQRINNKAERLGIYTAREIQKATIEEPSIDYLTVEVSKAPKQINTMNWLNRIGEAAEDYLYQNDEFLYDYVNFDPEESLDASQDRYITSSGRVETYTLHIAKLVFKMDPIVAEPNRTLNF